MTIGHSTVNRRILLAAHPQGLPTLLAAEGSSIHKTSALTRGPSSHRPMARCCCARCTCRSIRTCAT